MREEKLGKGRAVGGGKRSLGKEDKIESEYKKNEGRETGDTEKNGAMARKKNDREGMAINKK